MIEKFFKNTFLRLTKIFVHGYYMGQLEHITCGAFFILKLKLIKDWILSYLGILSIKTFLLACGTCY